MAESGQQNEDTNGTKNGNNDESKEPNQDAKPDQTKKPSGWVEWVKEHPAVVGTVAYVYVSFVGSMYDFFYLKGFGINFFDFAETNDFLTGAFRNPIILFFGLFGIFLLGSSVRAYPAWVHIVKSRNWDRILVFSVATLVGLVSAGVPILSAVTARGETRAGYGTYASVSLAQQADTVAILPDRLMLLGTSDKFVFFFDETHNRVHVVPSTNIASMRICRVPGSKAGDGRPEPCRL